LGALQVMTLEGTQVAQIHDFLALGDREFDGFELPRAL